jgi:hypothetical protein
MMGEFRRWPGFCFEYRKRMAVEQLLPGKQEAWRQFCQTLQGSRRHEYAGSLQRMGIIRQAIWLAQTAQVDTENHVQRYSVDSKWTLEERGGSHPGAAQKEGL